MPTQHSHIERIALPRSLVGRRSTFTFDVGHQVEFGGVPAIIIERSHSVMGREIYTIACFTADRPIRTVRGEALDSFQRQ